MSYEPTKRCSGCGEDKYVVGFYKNRCEDCYKARRKAYTGSVGYQHREYKKRAALYMLQRAARRAAKKQLPFELSVQQIQAELDKGVCALTGIPFVIRPGKRQFDAPSLDRIKPELGYVEGNVRVVLVGLNMALGDWGEETLFAMVDAMRRKRC